MMYPAQKRAWNCRSPGIRLCGCRVWTRTEIRQVNRRLDTTVVPSQNFCRNFRPQGSASVFMRFGTSPTLIRATSFMLFISIADTILNAVSAT